MRDVLIFRARENSCLVRRPILCFSAEQNFLHGPPWPLKKLHDDLYRQNYWFRIGLTFNLILQSCFAIGLRALLVHHFWQKSATILFLLNKSPKCSYSCLQRIGNISILNFLAWQNLALFNVRSLRSDVTLRAFWSSPELLRSMLKDPQCPTSK